MGDLETLIFLSQYDAILSPSVVAFRLKSGVKRKLTGRVKTCCRVFREIVYSGLSPNWLEGGRVLQRVTHKFISIL